MTEHDQQSDGQQPDEGAAGQRQTGEAATEAFAAEPLAGEGTDVDEATVTRGPAVGGATGVAHEGTAEDETA